MDLIHLIGIGASGGGEGGGGGGSSMMLLFVMLLGVWWFIYLGPQMKKQKAREKLLGAVKKGDRIVTRGGLLGSVVGVKEKVIVIRIAENVKIEILRGAVDTVLKEGE